MDPLNSLFNISQVANVDTKTFLVDIGITCVLAALMSFVYARYGQTPSNRGQLARVFVPLALTTMLIISIVKSSLALSLGLVGALSIVRFRSAIKSPEELIYLFICIAIGLGIGAGQRHVTIIAFLAITLLCVIIFLIFKRDQKKHTLVNISCKNPDGLSLGQILDTLAAHSKQMDLRRASLSKDRLQATVAFNEIDWKDSTNIHKALQTLNDGIEITLIDGSFENV